MKHIICVFLEVSIAPIDHGGTLPMNLLFTGFLPFHHALLVLPGITCPDNYKSLCQGVLL